jgi:hypothetical protein
MGEEDAAGGDDGLNIEDEGKQHAWRTLVEPVSAEGHMVVNGKIRLAP